MALDKVTFTVIVEATFDGELQVSEPASFTLAGVNVFAEVATGPEGQKRLRVRAGPPTDHGFARFEKTFMGPATFKLYRNNEPLQAVEVRNTFNATRLDLSNQG